jgi:hypothetical protein
MHINVVHLIGYLGKNPEHKSVKASDRKYAVLSLATQRSWKGADEEWHSKTEWHRVVVIWNLKLRQIVEQVWGFITSGLPDSGAIPGFASLIDGPPPLSCNADC